MIKHIMWSELRLFLWTHGLIQIGVILKFVSQWRLKVIQDEWCVIINVSVIGRPYIVGLNKTICVQVAAKFNANRLGWWQPGSFSTSSNQWNRTSNEKLWFLKHLWDVNLIWLEVKCWYAIFLEAGTSYSSRNSRYITIRRLWLISWSMNFNDCLY